jgi:hypothetical protein
MTAILKALETVAENPPNQVLIITDSLSSIQGLEADEDCSRPDIATEIRVAVTSLQNLGCIVKLAWIPAHKGIPGNENADKEANKGRRSQNHINTGLGPSEAKSVLRQIVKKGWRGRWDLSEKGRSAYTIFEPPSRKCQIKSILKIPINRKILKLQLGRANFLLQEEKYYCEECMVENNIQHMFECSLYEKERFELNQYCMVNKLQMTSQNMLNNKLSRDGKRALKMFISRVQVDI